MLSLSAMLKCTRALYTTIVSVNIIINIYLNNFVDFVCYVGGYPFHFE